MIDKILVKADEYIRAIYKDHKIWGFVVIGVLLLVAAYVFGVDLGGWLNNLLGVP